jgi:hypothetical protein
MQTQVSTLPTPGATALPFLPVPSPLPTFLLAPRCACGERLELEMEKDEGRCVNCAFQAAEAAWREGR